MLQWACTVHKAQDFCLDTTVISFHLEKTEFLQPRTNACGFK